jgi:Replication-relaxation
MVVQERDRHLLTEAEVLRVFDREQAKCVAGFSSTTRANSRLLLLTRSGFLRQFFLGTVGGARKALYALSPKGAALVGVPYRGPRRASGETLAGDFFTAHQLRINDLYCMVKYRPIPAEGTRFVRWLSFYEPVLAGIPLIPDGYAEIAAPAKHLAMFLEVDLGNESRTVWLRKVQSYLRYAVSGKFEERFEHPQFRTLVVANSERRMASLRAATPAITDKIFWFTTLEAIDRDGFWSPIWRRAADDARQSLI